MCTASGDHDIRCNRYMRTYDGLHLGNKHLLNVSSRHIAGENFLPEILNPPGNFCWCKFLNVDPALLADTAVFFPRAFVKKMLPPVVIFKLKIHQNAFAAGALPRPHWGSLQSFQTP